MMSLLISFLKRLKALAFAHWIVSSIAVVILLIGAWYFFGRAKPTYQFVEVTNGSIMQTVSVTGNTTPMKSVSLAFQNAGTIAQVNYNLGDKVRAGQVIAQLNTASLSAALAQARGAYDAAVASRSSTSLPEAATQARNTYLSAYTTLDTVLQNDVGVFFGGPTVYGMQLLINAPNIGADTLSKKRAMIANEMLTYQQSLSSAATSDPSALLSRATTIAQDTSGFLDTLSLAANDSQSGATSNQLTLLSTARSAVTTLLATLSTARDSYLTKSVGATSLADASVEQAQASVAAAEANLQNTKITAPISGVITQMDAKIGQLASPGTPLVSIIGDTGFEVDTGVSDTDIGKLAVGNTVSMTIDAFPNETFAGSVFYIAPAATNTQGVVSYLVKISFDKADPRLKSGLTANIDIQTKQANDVLILPQYAVLQNDTGTFVETLVNGVVTMNSVTLGIQDQNGNVEIVSGVTLGERVINIGLKQ